MGFSPGMGQGGSTGRGVQSRLMRSGWLCFDVMGCWGKGWFRGDEGVGG